jgi:hypothetical protein
MSHERMGTMTTPDPLGDAAEADIVEQATPVDPDGDAGDGSWDGAVPTERGEADEADLLEQSREVPVDDEFDR